MTEYPIRLPDAFNDALLGSRCSRLVLQALEEFSDFIARNEMIFFRQYTDHGPRHIEAIMESACALMTEASWEVVSPEDISVLAIATVLHDSALHLQEPSFLHLVKNSEGVLLPDLDCDPWSLLWTRYVSEVSRLSQSQLSEIFGVSDPIECPDLDNPDSWTPLQYMYIGEFIRRHHHRLAHEIACTGLPGIDSQFPPRDASDPLLPFVDLAGLVARSHGMPIRPLLPYLSRHHHIRTYDSSHPVYLMVLLRIADYLQLQSDRAPGKVAKIKRIQSPQSRREWKVHESIKDILYDQNEDPESVEIIVDPGRTSIDVFLRIQDWLHGIQSELDTSWAVLGEVFGRFKEKNLGLTIRRLRSNIDDKETFGRDAGFVPLRVTFSAADAELLKLLIKPLYGDRPEIAVRELVQNAVDAVRERRALSKEKDDGRTSDVEVQVKKLDSGKWSLVVEDFGMGMTYDTLSNFFLNAGASFRSSLTWKKQFQSDDGNSIVLRSGRFGVGALAAFLLADDPKLVSLKVSTRHIHADSNDGLEFEAMLTDRPLTIRYIKKETAGTRIEVITSSAPAFMQRSSSDDDNLTNEWDWFCLDQPRVRRIATSGRELVQQVKLPADVNTSPDDYHWLEPKGYQSVGWTFGKAPTLVCNGIIVAKEGKTTPSLEESESMAGKTVVRMPSLSVFDRDGKLPLTLDRLRVDFERISFLGELRDDVLRNVAAYLAVCAPSDIRATARWDVMRSKELQSHPAIRDSLERVPWVFGPKGVSILDPNLLSRLGVNNLVEVSSVKDIESVKSVEDGSQFAISVTSKSMWNSRTNKAGAIKAAKRGVYKKESFIDSVDERRLERAFQALHRSDRWRRNSFRPETHPEKFYDNFKQLLDRIDIPRKTFRRIMSSLKSQLQRHDQVTVTMEEAYRRLVDVLEIGKPDAIDVSMERVIDLIESRDRQQTTDIPIREFMYRFERRLSQLREVFYRLGGNEERIVRDLHERMERQARHFDGVTPQMLDALQLLERTSEREDTKWLLRAVRRVADVLEDDRAHPGRSFSRREAEHELYRARDYLEENDFKDEPIIRQILNAVYGWIRGDEEHIHPDAAKDALRTIMSLRGQERKNLDTDGSVSSSVVDWKKLNSMNLRDDFLLIEFELDQSAETSSESILGRVWLENLRQVVIPYDLKSRKQVLKHLWDRPDMKRHLEHWESKLSAAIAESEKS
ncbi:MAG: HD domain-containing protein [Arenicella sp.]